MKLCMKQWRIFISDRLIGRDELRGVGGKKKTAWTKMHSPDWEQLNFTKVTIKKNNRIHSILERSP